ncbi:hypothetical protein [Pseudomonas sp. FEN]|nr:hypothetical protein [Pseudomonas sp. FEN]
MPPSGPASNARLSCIRQQKPFSKNNPSRKPSKYAGCSRMGICRSPTTCL